MTQRRNVKARRIYDPALPEDGTRVLVDRIWPRGVTKVRAQLDEWCKDIAPSTELRKWYSHDPALFEEFAHRYRDELNESARAAAFAHLRDLAKKGTLTLLTATKNPDLSEAAVLADLVGSGKRPLAGSSVHTKSGRTSYLCSVRDSAGWTCSWWPHTPNPRTPTTW
jgi:uncharacterized protein YeaO (DUF488 family)